MTMLMVMVLAMMVTITTTVDEYVDYEVDDALLEVKTQTYHTSGTAGEKILGSPFKYAEIPELYSKPLRIVCIGGAERICREQYGNLVGPKCSIQKKRFIDFYKENNIEYVGATEILKAFVLKNKPSNKMI